MLSFVTVTAENSPIDASELGLSAATTAAAIQSLVLKQQQAASEAAGGMVGGVAASADASFKNVSDLLSLLQVGAVHSTPRVHTYTYPGELVHFFMSTSDRPVLQYPRCNVSLPPSHPAMRCTSNFRQRAALVAIALPFWLWSPRRSCPLSRPPPPARTMGDTPTAWRTSPDSRQSE